jgi:hypothetical protein
MAKAPTQLEALDSIRAQLEALASERERIADLPLALDEARARLEAWLARSGRDPVVQIAGAMAFPDAATPRLIETELMTAETLGRLGEQLVALLVALVGDRIRELVDARLPELTADGVSAEQRRKLLADLDAKALELELAEERLVRVLEADGLEIARRPHQDPRALLAADAWLFRRRKTEAA